MIVIGYHALKKAEEIPSDQIWAFFERSVRMGLRSFDKGISLSPKAMPYRDGSRSSAFASGESQLRIIIEENFQNSGNVYLYDLVQNTQARDLKVLEPDPDPYELAFLEVSDLFLVPIPVQDKGESSVDLDWTATGLVSKGFAFNEWLPLLSVDQRKFVDRDVTGPLRVRGPAGTGKTLTMVIKAIKIAKDAGDQPARIIFLTHSWAIASQIDELIKTIGRDVPNARLIEVYPLMEIASQRDYSKVGRNPLGSDSDQGKRQTLAVIACLLDDFVNGDWLAYKGGCSPEFVGLIEAPSDSRDRRNFAWDILLEFGCVFAADGLLDRGADLERYHRIRRMGYMMRLVSENEKTVVFLLWRNFLKYLRNNQLIATDQIVSDYLNELQTFYWEAKRSKDGYDYVFVDEMHLFNSQERLVFHNLLSEGDSNPKVVMALDPKQSPREVFVDISDDRDQKNRSIYERARLGNPDKIDFEDTYRYTEEIAALTKRMLDLIPGLDLNEDWNLPIKGSVEGAGPLPEFKVVENINEIFATAMSSAKRMQHEARKNQGQVAILCMDYERFSRLERAAAGQYPKDIFVISSRDDVERLRFAKQRIVFSTPEYVAGLQFYGVILIDANANLVPDGPFRGAQERRVLSELYLGMSRAERRLLILAARDSDGMINYIQKQIDDGLIVPAP